MAALKEPFYDGQEVIVKVKHFTPKYCVIDGQDVVFDHFLNKDKIYISFNSCFSESRFTDNKLSFYFATSTGKGFHPFYDPY